MGFKKNVIIFLIFLFVFSCGCGKDNNKTQIDNKSSSVTEVSDNQEVDEVQNENVRTQLIVGNLGYREKDKKILWVLSEEPQEKVSIINKKSDTVACECELSEIGVIYDGKMVYIGDFSGFRINGEYKAVCDDLEADFVIDNNIYDKEFSSQYDSLKVLDVNSIEEEYYRLSMLMLIYGIQADGYNDLDYIEKHIHRIIDDTSDGLESSTLLSRDNAEKRLQKSGVLAQFSACLKDKYPEMAEKAEALAIVLYDSVGDTKVSDDIRKFARTELYAATGYGLYTDISSEDSIAENSKTEPESDISRLDYTFINNLSLLMTKKTTDYDKCEALLNEMWSRASKISELSTRNGSYVYVNADSMELEALLEDIMILKVIDYAFSGGEYGVVQQNYIHYLYGRNIENRDRINNDMSIKEKSMLTFGLSLR